MGFAPVKWSSKISTLEPQKLDLELSQTFLTLKVAFSCKETRTKQYR